MDPTFFGKLFFWENESDKKKVNMERNKEWTSTNN
jgi:hypothetical protein